MKKGLKYAMHFNIKNLYLKCEVIEKSNLKIDRPSLVCNTRPIF